MKTKIKMLVAELLSSLLLVGCGDGTTSSSAATEQTIENLTKALDDQSNQEITDEYKEWIDAGKPDIELIENEHNITLNKYAVLPTKYELATNYDYSRSIKRATFPNKFNLRDPNGDGNTVDSTISPVKDQGQCGVCWSFAAYGTLEGSYNDTTNDFLDFSEDNLKHRHGFTHGSNSCAGGNIYMSANYMSRLDGAISEEEDPYSDSPYSSYCTDCTSHKYIDNLYIYKGRTSSGVDSQLIKDLLVNERKPVYISFEAGFGTAGESGASSYDPATKSFYASKDAKTNHAVVVVGYDDNMVAQGQTGCFIIKNSWGNADVTDNGYNYIPYSDKTIGKGVIAIFDDIDDNIFKVDKVYSHDTYGLTGYAFGVNEPHNYLMNIFTATGNEYIKAVNIGIWIEGRKIAIELHKLNGNTLPAWNDKNTRQGSRLEPNKHYDTGYHTIELDTPIEISNGDKFAIIVDYKKVNASTQFTLPAEAHQNGYTSNANANAGESYILWGKDWFDMGQNYNANWLLKAIVVDSLEESNIAPTAVIDNVLNTTIGSTVKLNGGHSNDINDDKLTYAWIFINKPNGSKATLSSSTNEDSSFKADAEGDYTIRLIVNDGILNSESTDIIISVSGIQVAL